MIPITRNITDTLFSLRDEQYAAFQRRLIPTLAPDLIIGVRTPQLRKLAKELIKSGEHVRFLARLPHKYFEENQLHGFIISEIKDFDICIHELELFLPHIDNWATCDQTSPAVFSRHAEKLLPHIRQWLKSRHCYTCRFAIGMLMRHFLDGRFDAGYIAAVCSVRSTEYYVKTEIAWYMATALTKQWDSALPFLCENALDAEVHNKAIQKACESLCISAERKAYLKTLKRKAR